MATAILEKPAVSEKVYVRLSEPWIYWQVGSVVEVTPLQAEQLEAASKGVRCGPPAKAEVIAPKDKMVRASTTKDLR
jgi:hypothetical protein